MYARRTAPALLASAALAVSLAPLAAPGAATAQPAPGSQVLGVRAGGTAFGSSLTGNPVLASGHSALSTMCTRSYPNVNRNQVASTQEGAGAVADLEEVESRNRTHTVDGRAAVTSTSTVTSGALLGGLVTFEGLRSVSRVVKTPGGFRRVSRATVAELEIAGEEVAVQPGNETQTFALPAGAGTLTFNMKDGRTGANTAVARNLALRLDLPDGGRLRVARSTGRLETGRVGIFAGGAWGTEVPTVAGLVEGGRTSFQPIPCRGTGGDLDSNGVTDAEPNEVVDSADSQSDVRTRYLSDGRARSMARTSVNDVSLGGGQIRIEEITSKAVALKRSDGSVRTSRSSDVNGLRVGGEEVEVPGENETLQIEGVATMEGPITDRGSRGVQVRAMRITLLDAAPEPVVVDLGVSGAYVRR